MGGIKVTGSSVSGNVEIRCSATFFRKEGHFNEAKTKRREIREKLNYYSGSNVNFFS